MASQELVGGEVARSESGEATDTYHASQGREELSRLAIQTVGSAAFWVSLTDNHC